MKQYDVLTVNLPNGETYAYLKAGGGAEVLLLLHGNMSSSVHWQTTMEALESGCTIFAPDLRGFGDSSYNSAFDSLADLARDVEMFAEALSLSGFYAAGWSTGGGVAMELAAARPDLVRGLILVDSVPPTGYPMFKKGADFKPILTEPLKTKADVAADPVQVIPALNALKNGDAATMRAIWDAVIYNISKPSDEDYAVYLGGIMKQRNLVDVDYALTTFNMTEPEPRLNRIQCPVTVLHGENDLVVPLSWRDKTLALFGERAKSVEFKNAGHSPVTDVPDAFIAALKAAMFVNE